MASVDKPTEKPANEVIHVRIDTSILDRVRVIEVDEDRHRAYVIQTLLKEALDARHERLDARREKGKK